MQLASALGTCPHNIQRTVRVGSITYMESKMCIEILTLGGPWRALGVQAFWLYNFESPDECTIL